MSLYVIRVFCDHEWLEVKMTPVSPHVPAVAPDGVEIGWHVPDQPGVEVG